MQPYIKHKLAPCIAVLGTGSDVGKSIVATALCRIFNNRGVSVAPYKAQNMSNNSGVTPEGLEMGRAQIVQAEAARIPPHVDMNPVLLKPNTEIGSQVVLCGKVVADATALEYHRKKEGYFRTAVESLDRLRRDYDLVVLEGAGSCAEVNLMAQDIVNLRMAKYADAPVVLVADIHRGGVFAQLVGTLACLSKEEQARIAGFVINRFRGDKRLFTDGVQWIEENTGKPVFGVIPWFSEFRIEAEDSVVIENPRPSQAAANGRTNVAVIRLPHISNFTDFDPLMAVEGLNVSFLEKKQDLAAFKAVILPGCKSTRSDLEWLHRSGWTKKIQNYAAGGGHVLGVCGGYQMLGRAVHDPEGHEGDPGTTKGLDLLPVETELKAPKTTTLTRFAWNGLEGTGYEIHMGRTKRIKGAALLNVIQRNGVRTADSDGASSKNLKIVGTYMHGLFDTPAITRHWLSMIGLPGLTVSDIYGPTARDRDYDRLAQHFERNLDLERIIHVAGVRQGGF